MIVKSYSCIAQRNGKIKTSAKLLVCRMTKLVLCSGCTELQSIIVKLATPYSEDISRAKAETGLLSEKRERYTLRTPFQSDDDG